MIAMIKTNADQGPSAPRGLGHGLKFRSTARTGLFNQDMPAQRRGAARYRCECVMGSCNQNNVHLRMFGGNLPLGSALGPGKQIGKRSRPFSNHVATDFKSAARECAGTFPTDQATADHSHTVRCGGMFQAHISGLTREGNLHLNQFSARTFRI
jgi:hypothetical protein